MAMDVECVANGLGHNDRVPCSVALVGESVLLVKKIKPPLVVSYLTEITGFRESDLLDARSFEEVRGQLLSHLGPHVVLVGQRVQNDIAWMQLIKVVFP
ncbi:hypothetical protein B484DRAFT_134343 [Ochromonadaceae sp. CCMP2298]|nr:hypothetical protein B484DRAFT_134343 [Ochromonadaceae sp. CCMP2298]